mmetsp:Transcript_22381/g.37435  ORF Transcript_22381/g.37435 Transcript_22381/m.37435 type:complete len:223 (-) Transcript_22381:817-1485(-)
MMYVVVPYLELFSDKRYAVTASRESQAIMRSKCNTNSCNKCTGRSCGTAVKKSNDTKNGADRLSFRPLYVQRDSTAGNAFTMLSGRSIHTVPGVCHVTLLRLFAHAKANQAWMKYRRNFGPTSASPCVPTKASSGICTTLIFVFLASSATCFEVVNRTNLGFEVPTFPADATEFRNSSRSSLSSTRLATTTRPSLYVGISFTRRSTVSPNRKKSRSSARAAA